MPGETIALVRPFYCIDRAVRPGFELIPDQLQTSSLLASRDSIIESMVTRFLPIDRPIACLAVLIRTLVIQPSDQKSE